MSEIKKKTTTKNTKTTKAKTTKAKTTKVEPKKTTKKPKVDYKAKLKKAKEELKLTKIKLEKQIAENQSNIKVFEEKAKTFASKAQKQINAIKQELNDKFNKEQDELKKYSSQSLIEAIIDPLLNIEMAVNAGKNDDFVKAYVMGFEMLLNQIYNQMSSYGINKIVPIVGDEFDPELHYALEVGDTSKIKDVKKAGFKLHDRIIKPATVIVE